MEEYKIRVNKVMDYITDNIGEEMTLEEMAKIAYFSKFHFHKIFKGVTGETVADFIKRTRLEKSVDLLLATKHSIIEIAYCLGFSSPAVFSREFKKYYNTTPLKFRNCAKNNSKNCKEIDYEIMYNKLREIGINKNKLDIPNEIILKPMEVTIEKIEDIRVLYIRFIGNYNNSVEMHKIWDRLIKSAEQSGALDEKSKGIGIIYDNPHISPKDKCRYDACVTIDAGRDTSNIRDKLSEKTIAGGEYAVFHFMGGDSEIHHAFNWIYGVWLAESRFELDDKPAFMVYERYVESGAEHKAKIYIALKK